MWLFLFLIAIFITRRKPVSSVFVNRWWTQSWHANHLFSYTLTYTYPILTISHNQFFDESSPEHLTEGGWCRCFITKDMQHINLFIQIMWNNIIKSQEIRNSCGAIPLTSNRNSKRKCIYSYELLMLVSYDFFYMRLQRHFSIVS